MKWLLKRIISFLKQIKRSLKQFFKRLRSILKGKWIPLGFCLALIFVASISLISYRNAKRLTRNAAQLRESNERLQMLSGVSITLAYTELRHLEASPTVRLSDLKTYQITIQTLKLQLEKLKNFPPSLVKQQQWLSTLGALITRRESLFQALIEQQKSQRSNIDYQRNLIAEIRQNQDSMRRIIVDYQNSEEEFLKSQAEYFQTGFENRMVLELVGTLSTFILLFGIYGLASYQKAKRQQAEAQQQTLAQAQVMSDLKLQFFSMVSHEFRTPLSHILGSAQLLEETLKPLVEPIKLKNLYRIQASAKLVTQLLNDVLTLARADAGKLEYNPKQVEIQTFCLNLLEDFHLSDESQHVIKFAHQGDRTHAWVDEKLMYSILSNLLSNAIKYSAPLSTIAFTLVSEADWITFQIQDEGIGIAREDFAELYQPFVRGKNVQKTIGTGLGLTVVKKCLDLHQGHIAVDSKVGSGTTFTVRIPQDLDRSR